MSKYIEITETPFKGLVFLKRTRELTLEDFDTREYLPTSNSSKVTQGATAEFNMSFKIEDLAEINLYYYKNSYEFLSKVRRYPTAETLEALKEQMIPRGYRKQVYKSVSFTGCKTEEQRSRKVEKEVTAASSEYAEKKENFIAKMIMEATIDTDYAIKAHNAETQRRIEQWASSSKSLLPKNNAEYDTLKAEEEKLEAQLKEISEKRVAIERSEAEKAFTEIFSGISIDSTILESMKTSIKERFSTSNSFWN